MTGELDASYFASVASTLRARGVELAHGLTEAELVAAERAHGFRFPPDLRALLAHVLPVDKGFPDWRYPTSAFIADRLAWPADGICFDVEHDSFWIEEWGTRPSALPDAFARARAAVREAPFLIPIFAHRYLPATPCTSGNPVFSVHQTDVIFYGNDLASYLEHEFHVPNPLLPPSETREIELWSELVRRN